jgi:hypothetical protein
VSPTAPKSIDPSPSASMSGGPYWNSTHLTLGTPSDFSRASIVPCWRATTSTPLFW